MTFILGILFAVVIWLVWRKASSKKAEVTHEIPITVKVSYESSGGKYKTESDVDNDNWEGSFWDVQEPFPVKASLRIDYEDGAGKKSERVVDVRQFGSYGYGNLLIAHCHMRNATRTFRTDRIKSCVDVDTGEVVEDVSTYLRTKYEASPSYVLDKLFEEEYDALRILFYVGKADGQLRAAERMVIRDVCRTLAKDSRITDEKIDDLFTNLDAPTLQAFKLAVGRLAQRESEVRAALILAAEKIVATQKTVHPSEKEAIDYIHRRFALGVDNEPAASS